MNVVIRVAESAVDRFASWSLRERVFIAEQGIAEAIERDGLDDVARHLVAWEATEPVGTARIIGLDGEHRPVAFDSATVAKIGRMAVLPAKRGLGIGRRLLDAALELARRQGIARAELSAQAYVVPFYERAGFCVEGERYEEAGIFHRKMSRSLGPRS